MNPDTLDDFIAGIIRRAIVPKGFRPRSDQELHKALDALGDVEISTDKARDMLEKIRSDRPFLIPVNDDSNDGDLSLSESAEELVEMFRAEGEDIPPEVAERIRELEQLAAEEADEMDYGDEADGE